MVGLSECSGLGDWHGGGVSHQHPPIDFPVYGLATSQMSAVPTWLAAADGQAGHPLTALWLAHGDNDDQFQAQVWALVGSVSRARALEVMMTPGQTFEEHLAFEALMILFDDGLHGGNEFQARAEEYLAWSRVAVTVDGRSVSGRVVTHGGDWAVMIAELEAVGIVVLGRGLDPDDLELVTLPDASRYHFDLSSPLDYPDALLHSRAVAFSR